MKTRPWDVKTGHCSLLIEQHEEVALQGKDKETHAADNPCHEQRDNAMGVTVGIHCGQTKDRLLLLRHQNTHHSSPFA